MTKETIRTGAVMPLEDMVGALFRGFAPITDRKTDTRDCANYFEPLKDDEEDEA